MGNFPGFCRAGNARTQKNALSQENRRGKIASLPRGSSLRGTKQSVPSACNAPIKYVWLRQGLPRRVEATPRKDGFSPAGLGFSKDTVLGNVVGLSKSNGQAANFCFRTGLGFPKHTIFPAHYLHPKKHGLARQRPGNDAFGANPARASNFRP